MGRAAKLFGSRVAAASASNTAALFVVALRCTAIAGKPLEPHPHTGILNISEKYDRCHPSKYGASL
jgi:hypothetical protein